MVILIPMVTINTVSKNTSMQNNIGKKSNGILQKSVNINECSNRRNEE